MLSDIVLSEFKENNGSSNVVDINFQPKEIWRIYKNVVVLSLAFMLQFTAYNGVANLQSSINAQGGLGTAALAAVYAGLIVSSLLLPSIVISIFGCKWGVSLSLLLYMPYVGVQMAPSFWTLIPAALLEGMAGGGLWCSKCTYLSALSEAHNKISGVSAEVVLVRFFSIFYMTFQFNQVFGNLISSLVLSSGDNGAAVTSVNDSMIPDLCGAHFLPSVDSGSAFPEQPPEKIRLMIGIYLACMACASLLVAVALDSKKRYDPILKNLESDKKSSAMELLVNTMRLLKETDQMLLIPITIFVGMIQAFFGTDFTAAFVSCSIGTGSVGFVMMTLGVADAFGCFISGYIAKWTGRAPMMTAAMVVQALQFCVILFWKPEPTHHVMIYGVAALWGLCDSVWMVQVNSYYGVLFPGREQAGYANFRLWESVGFIISYLISDPLRTSVKSYILLVLLFVGVACYFVVEFREYKRREGIVEKTENELGGRDNIAFQ